jgi:hypothetical protein
MVEVRIDKKRGVRKENLISIKKRPRKIKIIKTSRG